MLSEEESLHDEFTKLLQDIYHAIKFENANFSKISAMAKIFEVKLLDLSDK